MARPSGRTLVRDVCILVLLAAGLAVFLHWNALTQPDRFHNNWRQSPHWISPQRQQFQPDDPMIRYAHANTSPFANLLYKTLARTGYDVFWGKFNTVAFFALTIGVIYVTGRAMGGRLCGWAAAAMFMLFPCELTDFAGGFMSGLSIPFVCMTVFLVHQQRWWWLLPLIALEFQVYPMGAIQSGAIVLIDVCVHDRRRLLDPVLWKRKFIPLLLTAAACYGLLVHKYSGGQEEFGKLVTRVEIKNRIEFHREGRAPLIPTDPVTEYLTEEIGEPFHAAIMLLAFLVLGKGMFRLPRGLWPLLTSCILLYWLADILMIRLYFPSRYVNGRLPLFFALAASYWLSRMWTETRPGAAPLHNAGRRQRWRVATAALLIAVGFWEYGDKLIPPGDLPTRRYVRRQLYDAVRSLPDRPLLAAHPFLAGELPIMTGKSVLMSHEMAHPWWPVFYEFMIDRGKDFFRGYYALDPDVLKRIIRKHDIDYWVVDQRHFHSRYLEEGEFCSQPLQNFVRRQVRPTSRSLLTMIPTELRVYDDGRYSIVSSEVLLEWLSRPVRSEEAADAAPGGSPS